MVLFAMLITDLVKEDVLLTCYFSDPVMLDLIQHTPAAPHLEGLIAALIEGGYSPVTIQRYARSAAHLSYWQQCRAQLLTDLDATNIGEFKQHLRSCRCKGFQRVNEYDLRGAQMFLPSATDDCDTDDRLNRPSIRRNGDDWKACDLER
jgi:hypothetical protein